MFKNVEAAATSSAEKREADVIETISLGKTATVRPPRAREADALVTKSKQSFCSPASMQGPTIASGLFVAAEDDKTAPPA